MIESCPGMAPGKAVVYRDFSSQAGLSGMRNNK